MFDRFNEGAQHVIVLAQGEVSQRGDSHVGPEHLLLGLILEGQGIPAKLLAARGVTAERVKSEIEANGAPGSKDPRSHPLYTLEAKKVLEFSLRQALMLGHNYIGPEHILLGIICRGDTPAVAIITKLYGEPTELRQEVLAELDCSVVTPATMLVAYPTANEQDAVAIPPGVVEQFMEWYQKTYEGPRRAVGLDTDHPLQVFYSRLAAAFNRGPQPRQ